MGLMCKSLIKRLYRNAETLRDRGGENILSPWYFWGPSPLPGSTPLDSPRRKDIKPTHRVKFTLISTFQGSDVGVAKIWSRVFKLNVLILFVSDFMQTDRPG